MQNDSNHYIRLRSATALERLASMETGASDGIALLSRQSPPVTNPKRKNRNAG